MMMVMLVLATVVVALVVMVVRVMLSFLHETSVYAQELLCCVFQLSVPSCRESQERQKGTPVPLGGASER